MNHKNASGASSDPPAWRTWPVLVAFHQQWHRARGKNPGKAKLPFSREWEALLREAGLITAEAQAEAERDARALAAAGLWEIRAVPRRPQRLDRIRLPLSQELRLARLFGDNLTPIEKFDPKHVDWEPELAFLTREHCTVGATELLAIQEFLKNGGRTRPLVPLKERSVTLFGDEKRLDALLGTSLFREGRLSLATLRAYLVPEPLGWRRGPREAAAGGAFLVVENAATWDSFARWNEHAARYAAVIYGAGHRFLDGLPFLHEIAREVAPVQRLDYFGDLDPEGLRLPGAAAGRCAAQGLPVPQPLAWAYQLLLEIGQPAPFTNDRDVAHAAVSAETASSSPLANGLAWLGPELALAVRVLFQQQKRLAQEWVGHEVLSKIK